MLSKQKVKFSLKLGAILLFTITLLVGFILAASKTTEIPCRGLKSVNNLDELLYQFYINLDSECLFKMPVTELEKVWDIKILSDERLKPGEKYFQLRESDEFKNKPYKSEKDAFYVRLYPGRKTNTNVFEIDITKEYYEKHGTLFPDGNFPKLLPEPLKLISQEFISPMWPESSEPEHPSLKHIGKYIYGLSYYWLNSDQTCIIHLRGIGGVNGFTMLNQVKPDHIDK